MQTAPIVTLATPLPSLLPRAGPGATITSASLHVSGDTPMQSIRLALPLLGLAAFLLPLLLPRVIATQAGDDGTERARKFVDADTAKMRPLEIAANRAWWNANIDRKSTRLNSSHRCISYAVF